MNQIAHQLSVSDHNKGSPITTYYKSSEPPLIIPVTLGVADARHSPLQLQHCSVKTSQWWTAPRRSIPCGRETSRLAYPITLSVGIAIAGRRRRQRMSRRGRSWRLRHCWARHGKHTRIVGPNNGRKARELDRRWWPANWSAICRWSHKRRRIQSSGGWLIRGDSRCSVS